MLFLLVMEVLHALIQKVDDWSLLHGLGNGWAISFNIRLHGILREQWYCLAADLNNVILNNDQDVSFWKWSPNKTFTIKFVYEHLSREDVGPSFSRVW
jgi:hypothetical protein